MTSASGGNSDNALDIHGAVSGIRQPCQVVVRNPGDWAALWAQHEGSGGSPAPAVDFAAHNVVAVFVGARPTGGYRVQIDGVDRRGDEATVHVTLLTPPKGALTTQAFTYPFAARAVPTLPERVTFAIEERPAPG